MPGYFQREYVRENVAMTLNNTYRLDLPEHGMLGSLLIRVTGSQVSGLGASGGSWRISDFISLIEVIVNGSTIVKSIPGQIAQLLAVLDQGVMPPDAWRNYATNTQQAYFLINFGRWLFDPDMAFDLGRYDDVELRITNTATAAEFSDLTVSALGYYMRGDIVPALPGYHRTEVWRSWTTVQDETTYLTLPTEHRIRRVVMQMIPDLDASNVEETNMANLADDIEYTFRTGETRVYKGGLDDLMRENYYDHGLPLLASGSHYMSADKGVDISLGYVLGGAWGAGSQDGAGAATIATMESARTSFTQKPETFEADSPMNFTFNGIAPFEAAWFRHDYDRNPLNYLDPREEDAVELDIHCRNAASAADGTARVILDRYVPA